MEDIVKRIIITVLLLGTAMVASAQAAPQVKYKDLIRPNGHLRSAAVYQADVDDCYRQTGGTPYLPDSAAMKKCMLSRGYRFMWQRGFASRSARSAPYPYPNGPDPNTDTGADLQAFPQPPVGPDPNSFVTPETPVVPPVTGQ